MVLEYFDLKRFKKDNTAKNPVLNEADEQFLHKITSQEEAPPFPEKPTVILDNGSKVRGKDAQTALMAGADQIPLPTSPSAEDAEQHSSEEDEGKVSAEEQKRRNYWSYLPALPSMPSLPSRGSKGKEKTQTADDLQTAVDAVKAGDDPLADSDVKGSDKNAKDENEELTSILDQLNLSAVNNRAFSFSKESEKLLSEFTLILKDLVNGVPTAYDDLEKLLTRSEGQLQNMYGNMPPFLQTLVKSLPAKMTSTLAPELMAVMGEKPGVKAQSVGSQSVGAQTSTANKDKKRQKRSGIPSLKSLVSQQGTVATMLRSILNFLKLRFPAFITGTNVLMSLSVFLLLFVFWYCHKRGRETRLSVAQAEGTSSDMEKGTSDPEDSTVLENRSEDVEPPIKIHEDPGAEEKPSTTVADLPSVLDLPEPKTVPVPKEDADVEMKEAPLEAK